MKTNRLQETAVLLTGLLLTATPGHAQQTNSSAAVAKYPPVVHLTARQDHERLMKLLHLTSIRRGADGMNPKSPYYANYDEAKANPYPHLPDPLVLNDGQKVTTPEMWWKLRRPQIVEDFDRDIYGRVPAHTPRVIWKVTGIIRTNVGTVPVITKELLGHVDNSAYPLIDVTIHVTLTTPAHAARPVPVMIQLAFKFSPEFLRRLRARGFPGFGSNGPAWHRQVLAQGWGYAEYYPYSVQADNGAGLTEGIIGLCNKGQPRKLDDWGALRAWAWGASRVLDYLETDKAVDAKHVGVEGHSRFGKAALIAMAFDSRFAAAYVSSSGEAGAKLYRRHWGETIGNIAGSGEYHWMAGNFIKYAGPLNARDLPVDAHELIALCAPRPVFISAGTLQKGDGWVDARGMFMAAAAAGPVYRLLGGKDMGTTNFPPTGTALVDGDIAFRQHHQGHTDAPNWPTFIKFAKRHFDRP